MPPLAFRNAAISAGTASANSASPAVQQQVVDRLMARANRIRRQRWTGPQQYYTRNYDFNTQTSEILPTKLVLEKPHERLLILAMFRLTITTADYTTVLPEAPQTLLRQLRVWGNAGAFGAQTMTQMTGATLFAAPYCFDNAQICFCEINGVQIDPPSIPFLPALSGAQGIYDIIVVWQVPTAPWGIQNDTQRSRYTFSPQDWGNTISVETSWGDRTSIGTPAGGTVATFTAYNSTTGLPTVSYYQNFALLGKERAMTKQNALVLRTERQLTNFTAAVSQAQLAQLEQRVTTNILVKSGRAVTSSTGLTNFASLSNTQLNNTRVKHGTTDVRLNQSNLSYRAYYNAMFGLRGPSPQGYLPESFIEQGNALTAYRADALESGAIFWLYTDVDDANAANMQSVLQEMVIQGNAGGPFGPVVEGV